MYRLFLSALAFSLANLPLSVVHASPITQTVGTVGNSSMQFQYALRSGELSFPNGAYPEGAQYVVNDYTDLTKSVSRQIDQSGTTPGSEIKGSESASINVAKGILRARISGSGSGYGQSMSGFMSAYFQDQIYLNQPVTHDMTATVSMSVDGNMGCTYGFMSCYGQGFTGSTMPGVDYFIGTAAVNYMGYGSNETILPLDYHPSKISANFHLVPGTTSFIMGAAIEVLGQAITDQQVNSSSFMSDFSNTAQLSIELPQGYTFHDQTGMLLTQSQGQGSVPPPTNAVPEPSSLQLLATGLLGVLISI